MIRFEIPQNIDFSDSALALKQMWSYIQSMQEQMTVILRNLGMENFNAAGLSDITAPIKRQIADVEGNVTEVKVTAEGASVTASDALGKAATAQITASGASVTASNALGAAQSVALTVNGFTVTGPGGQTLINGDYIKSGTIEGVALVSKNSDREVVVEDGALFFESQGSFRGSVGGDSYGITIQPRAGYALRLFGDVEIGEYGTTTISGYPLKLDSYSNMSIDANGTIYIGASSGGNNVTIGNFGGSNRIALNGDVYINGVLYEAPSGE